MKIPSQDHSRKDNRIGTARCATSAE